MPDGDLRNREFLGQGLAFPLQFGARGGLALAAGERDIVQSIRLILETTPGERVMRPEFGCRARELLFAPRNAATEALLVLYVEQALGRWEPRIQVTAIEAKDDPANDGAWLVEIRYEIKATHDERSLVHPFYIMTEE
jgi:phage baseplate assembly protein W